MKDCEVPGGVDLRGLSFGKAIPPHIFFREASSGRSISAHSRYNGKNKA